MVKNREYLYISPCFTYAPDSGAVVSLISAALTNSPALDGMDEVTALALQEREELAAPRSIC